MTRLTRRTGLALLLLKRGDTAHAGLHLESFLRHSSDDDDASVRFRAHAQQTLDRLKGLMPTDEHAVADSAMSGDGGEDGAGGRSDDASENGAS